MNLWRELIVTAATKHGLDPLIVTALVQVESSGNRHAFRPEAHYRWLYDVRAFRPFRTLTPDEIRSVVPPPDFPYLEGSAVQEWTAQRASWGLMQLMGAVARELGFRGPFLTELVEPEVNLEIGCRLLADRMRWAKGDVGRGLAAYNAGPGNVAAGAAYAANVLRHYEALRAQP